MLTKGISASGNTFIEQWSSIIQNIHNFRIGDTVMGLICIVLLLLMRLLVTIKIGSKEDIENSKFIRVVNKLIWLIGTSRNAILVVVCGGIGAAFYKSGTDYFKLIGFIPSGLPIFQAPPFFIPEVKNETTGEVEQYYETFGEMVSYMGSGLIVVPLIALLEDIAICKAFG